MVADRATKRRGPSSNAKSQNEEKLTPMQILTSNEQSPLDGGSTTLKFVALSLVTIGLSLTIGFKNSLFSSSSSHSQVNSHSIVPYTCPAHVETSDNDNHPGIFKGYQDNDARVFDKTLDVKHLNKTLDDFRNVSLDAWSYKYPRLKRMLKPWKEEVFVPHLKSGDSLYESACGSGMNLLVSVETLAEHNIHNITVYGNDYVQESIDLANYAWNTEGAKALATKGHLCRGDSSNLDFVPSSSFDLVYTGYIDPLNDPLNLLTEEDLASGDDDAPCQWQSSEFCESDDPIDKYLAKQEQLEQENWFASWVSEMLRIAKPGKVVAIESIAESICKVGDWGGVDKTWWSAETVKKYGWDVDPSSIIIRQVPKEFEMFSKRYQVMMKKNE